MTDNRNRAAADVRHAFSKQGGNLGESGCVGWMFKSKGVFVIDKEGHDEDELTLLALDAGAEDFSDEEEAYEIITAPADFSAVREALEKENYPMASAEVTMIPQNYVELTDENDIRQLNRTLDLLDEDDDVQDVYHNWDE